MKPLDAPTIAQIATTMPDLAELITIIQGGTPGQLQVYRSGTTSHEEAAAYIMAALEPHAASDLLVLGVDTDTEIKKAIAIFGNGPDAEANIRRAGAAMMIAPALIAMVGGLTVAIEEAQQAITAGCYASAWGILHDALGDMQKGAQE